jgi:hypothetical protein
MFNGKSVMFSCNNNKQIMAGVVVLAPARVFSQRNIEHYETLKAEGKFH